MRDVYYYETIEQVQAIAEPTRWRILDLLVRNAMTGAQIARALGIPRTRAHYHLKVLERLGLVELTNEQINQGIVEKYYRAIAKVLLTDKLIDRKAFEDNGADTAQTSQTIAQLMLAIMELARIDIMHLGGGHALARYGFQRQDNWFLTSEQADALALELRALAEKYATYDQENRSAAQDGSFVHIRHTWLLTPVAPFSFDGGSEASGEADSEQS
jgi:DNA-binding transcriptional ArsR family regulator